MKEQLKLSLGRGPQGQAILHVEGAVDLHTFKQFEAAFRSFDEQRLNYLVVDLALMTYITSSGLGLLIKAKAERVQKDGDVVLVRPQTSVLNILKVLGLMDLFRVASSVEEALVPPAPRDGA